MKSLKLVIMVKSLVTTAVMLSVTSFAQAESVTNQKENMNRLNHHFSSKRPYQAPVENKQTTKADEQWEGATLVPNDETSVESKNARNLKQLRINSLGRRPYIE